MDGKFYKIRSYFEAFSLQSLNLLIELIRNGLSFSNLVVRYF